MSNDDVILASILLLAIALRIVWMLTQAAVINSDGGEYARMAESLLHDHSLVGTFEGPEVLYAPLFSCFIAATMLFISNSELAAHVVSILAGTVLVGLVFLVANYMYGLRVARICALLSAVLPISVALSGSVYNETLYSTMLMAVVYCALRAMELQRRGDYVLLGLCLGLAYLTRVEALAYLLFFVLALLTTGLVQRQPRKAALGVAILLAAFVLIASPYVGFFYRHTGSLRLEAKWAINYTLARNRLAGMSAVEADYGLGQDLTMKGPILAPFEFADFTPYSDSLLARVKTLCSMADHNKYAVYDYLRERAIGAPILFVLVIVGLFRSHWSYRRCAYEAIVFTMASSILVVVLTSATAEFRYFLPIVPLLLLWAGKGIAELQDWLIGCEPFRSLQLRRLVLLSRTVTLCSIALLVLYSAVRVKDVSLFAVERSSTAVAERDAGHWLASYHGGPKRIAVRGAVIPYYANGTLIDLPFADPETTRRYLRAKNVDFVVLESRSARQLPTVAKWLSQGIPDSRTRLIYDETNSAGDRIAIYQWLQDRQL